MILQDVPPQDVISRDNVSVKVNAVIYLRSEVEADQEVLRTRQAGLEDLLAAEKARYLLGRFAQSLDASDLRRRKLIDRVLADFDHLLDKATHD